MKNDKTKKPNNYFIIYIYIFKKNKLKNIGVRFLSNFLKKHQQTI